VAVSFAAVSLTMAMPADAKAAKGSSHSKTKNTENATKNDDTAIRAQIDAFTENLAKGNASSLSALWTENGSYIDEDGNVFQGRSALEKRFALVFLNEDGNWLISQATETPITTNTSAQPKEGSLKDLDWLIGSWKAERNGSSVRMTAEWAANKNFIHCKYEIQ